MATQPRRVRAPGPSRVRPARRKSSWPEGELSALRGPLVGAGEPNVSPFGPSTATHYPPRPPYLAPTRRAARRLFTFPQTPRVDGFAVR
jgi:hypothetical protein